MIVEVLTTEEGKKPIARSIVRYTSPSINITLFLRFSNLKKFSFSVNTLLPGSYGLLCGLGPGGVDFPPYGPKTFHFRVSAPGYKTLVTEVEVDGEVSFSFYTYSILT